LYLEEIDSTNKYAKEHIEELDDRTVVFAGRQLCGRGRLDRKWQDNGRGNIYATFVLKPSKTMQTVYSNLTQYLCLILVEIFEEYNLKPTIKWPNDILVNGKKISGILAESVIVGNSLEGLVLGVGINLNCNTKSLETIDQPATSLNIETGMEIDKDIFLKHVTEKFFLSYDRFITEGFSLIKNDYKKRASFLHKQLKIKVFDNEIEGFAEDITNEGALKIIKNNKKEQILYMGDIL